MEKPVSIIIPTYNRKEFLSKAVDSVLAQSYPYYELIIVDDGSEDNTAELFASHDPRIIYLRQENRGPAAARNSGIQKAKHELIAFLDSDDRFAENKLDLQVRAMQAEPTFLISHTQEIWYRKGSLLNQKKKHQKCNGDIFKRSLQLCAVGMSTVMMHRGIFERYGFFDEEYPCCEDYEFWLRVSTEQEFLLVDQPLTLKDGGRNDQVSTIYRMGMDKFRIQAIMKLLIIGKLTGNQKASALEELERKCQIYGRGCVKHGRVAEGKYYLNLPKTAWSRQSA
ncbi:MAG: glycosyltransferase [Deltaproteobacteria bacterium]|jgi:glycosyltransferase involved in cell wall biosynthesis|nr:glycosyltransferase [Deltaproteobacteria bacterium]